MSNEEPVENIRIVEVSLEKVRRALDPLSHIHWLVEKMDHFGIPLYLILHHEDVEILSSARPVGLEVNLPTGINVYMATDAENHGRGEKRLDLVFEKHSNKTTYYYLVEVTSKYPSGRDLTDLKEYTRRFRENLGSSYGTISLVPLIVCPKESVTPI